MQEDKESGKEPVHMIITADTIISQDDQKVFEKPNDKEHAFEILASLRDAGTNQAYTSVWIAFLDPET